MGRAYLSKLLHLNIFSVCAECQAYELIQGHLYILHINSYLNLTILNVSVLIYFLFPELRKSFK